MICLGELKFWVKMKCRLFFSVWLKRIVLL